MYFQAESDGKKFEINVVETKSEWRVSLKAEGGEWVQHDILKENYRDIDDTVSFLFKNSSYLVDVTGSGTDYTVFARGAFRNVKIFNEERILHESLKGGGSFGAGDLLTAGMPGKISKIFVKTGDLLNAGDPVLVMEAMKMENEMRAGGSVRVKHIHVKEGDTVESGAQLVSFEKADA